MQENIKSRIFLSCGQKTSKDNNEVEIASQISDKLTDIGFEVYMAIGKQSLKSIKENIFPKLEEAEYFLFIDFKREKLDTGEYRGSLFSNQELAVATFLDKEVLIFQEKGIKMRDGLLSSIQANSILFDDRTCLLKIIEDKIRELNWNLNWRNELVIQRELQDEYEDATWRRQWKDSEIL